MTTRHPPPDAGPDQPANPTSTPGDPAGTPADPIGAPSRRPPTTLAAAATIAGNDLRRRLRDRSLFITGVAAPVIMAALIGLALGGVSSFSATIGLVDADGSPVSAGIVDGLVSGMPADAPLKLQRVGDEAAARADLEAGTLDAVLVLPAGFGAAVQSAEGQPRPVTVVADAGRQVSGAVARSLADGIAARIDASRLAVATALAGGATDPTGGAPDPAAVIDAAGAIQPAIDLAMEGTGDAYPPAAYFGASMAILFLFFTVGAGARSLLAEQDDGTLARVRAAPVADRALLLGKSASTLVLGVASLVTVWLITSLVFGARWGDPAAVLVVIVAVVLAVAGIGSMVTGVARTLPQADAYTSLVGFVLALLGGSFQPSGSLPGAMRQLSLLTPNGWALRAFTRIGAADAGVVDVLPTVGVLVATAVVTATIGVRLLRRRVMT